MKKLIALLLTVLMVISMTACGGDKPASTPAATDASKTTEAQPAGSTEAPATGWVPTKDIEFVIPFGAGGGNDIMVRKMVEIIEKYKLCPVNVVPVNKKGGSGVVGYTYLKDYKVEEISEIIRFDEKEKRLVFKPIYKRSLGKPGERKSRAV